MCSVAIAVSPLISLVSSVAATTQLTDTGAALVTGAGDISAPALLRHKTSLITGTVIVKNCEAQGKGRAKGRLRKVTQRSFINGGWWMVDIFSLMLYIKFGCHHHHHP